MVRSVLLVTVLTLFPAGLRGSKESGKDLPVDDCDVRGGRSVRRLRDGNVLNHCLHTGSWIRHLVTCSC